MRYAKEKVKNWLEKKWERITAISDSLNNNVDENHV